LSVPKFAARKAGRDDGMDTDEREGGGERRWWWGHVSII